jgi:RND family efflux transporter MFP subunit
MYNRPLIILTIILFSSCNEKARVEQHKQPDNIIPVKLAPIVTDTIYNDIVAAGILSTEEEARLSFKTGGVIDRVLVAEGQFVKRGQHLASIKSGEVDAQVEEVQLAYQKARREYQRTVNLYLDKVATLEQMQNSKTGIDMAYQTVQQVTFNRQFSNIYAVSDGFVVKKLLNAGEVAGAGLPVLVMRSVSEKSKWVVRLSVADKQWAVIPNGSEASVTVDAYPGRIFKGIVSNKSMAADPATGTFSVEVAVDFKNIQPALGMFATAKITSGAPTLGHIIPFDALVDANGSDGYVFVSDDRKTVHKVGVTISRIGNDEVYLKDGLKDHRFVIVSGSPYLKDNSIIRQVE